MSGIQGKRGFTLLEMLAATVLLGLMATLGVSLFRQSAIAQSVGEASVEDCSRRRREIACAARLAAETVPVAVSGAGPVAFRVMSAWDADGNVRRSRPFERMEAPLPAVGAACRRATFSATEKNSGEVVTVVVASAGPDGRWGTDDDLSTDVEEADE